MFLFVVSVLSCSMCLSVGLFLSFMMFCLNVVLVVILGSVSSCVSVVCSLVYDVVVVVVCRCVRLLCC